MRLLLPLIVASTSILAAGARPAHAVSDIRFERWFVPGGIKRDVVAPVDSTTAISVGFDATVTAGDQDPGRGLRFAIAERDPGDNDVLVRFELADLTGPSQCVALAPVGSTVTIGASIRVYCDAAGELHANGRVRWSASWCDLPQQHTCQTDEDAIATTPEASEPENWEFVVLGDGDVEGSFPTPEDVVACGGPEFPGTQYEAPEFAASGSLGIFADPSGIVCSDNIVPFQPFRWYLVASLDGMTRCGVTTLEFGIPLPPDFFINAIPNPNATMFGSPWGQCALGFQQCEQGDGDHVVLLTLEGATTSVVHDLAVTVGAAMPPSNQYWPYPWTDLCGPLGARARRHLRTSTFYINPTSPHGCEKTVPATPVSWSAMKSLYRD